MKWLAACEREGDRWHAARPSHICILSSPAEAYPALRSLARRATEGEGGGCSWQGISVKRIWQCARFRFVVLYIYCGSYGSIFLFLFSLLLLLLLLIIILLPRPLSVCFFMHWEMFCACVCFNGLFGKGEGRGAATESLAAFKSALPCPVRVGNLSFADSTNKRFFLCPTPLPLPPLLPHPLLAVYHNLLLSTSAHR